MIDYAFQQLDIANEIDSQRMRAHAYLNLSIGNGAMSHYDKSITYCEHALEHLADGNGDSDKEGIQTLCQVYLDMAKSHIGLSSFNKALEYLDLALKLARQIHDSDLELECYSLFGDIFTMLKDFEKGFQFHSRAHQFAKTFRGTHTRSKVQRQTELNLAHPLRKLGRLTDAVSFCQVRSDVLMEYARHRRILDNYLRFHHQNIQNIQTRKPSDFTDRRNNCLRIDIIISLLCNQLENTVCKGAMI